MNKEILMLLLRNWRSVALVGFISGVLGFLAATFAPKTYYSQIDAVIADENGSAMMGSLNLAGFDGLESMLGNANSAMNVDAFINVLMSRDVLLKTYHQFGLDSVYKKKADNLRIKKFSKDLVFEPEDTGMLGVGYYSKNKEMCKELVEFLVQTAETKWKRINQERIDKVLFFNKERVKELEDSLGVIKVEIQKFYQENKMVNAELELEKGIEILSELESEKQKLEAEKSVKTSLFGDGAAQDVQQKLAALKNQIFKMKRGQGSSIKIDYDKGPSLVMSELEFKADYQELRKLISLMKMELLTRESELKKQIPVLLVTQEAYLPDWKERPKRVKWAVLSAALATLLYLLWVVFSALHRKEINRPPILEEILENVAKDPTRK